VSVIAIQKGDGTLSHSMQGGYLALLDVLGFSALVAGDVSGQRIRDYLDCLQRTSTGGAVDFVVFSDSIVLTAKGDGPDAFLAVAKACSRLFLDLLREGIPLRGAIVYGDFFRSAVGESVFVAGRAVIDAYNFEQLQDWVGIMIAPSARARHRELPENCQLRDYTGNITYDSLEARIAWAAFVQRFEHIPFHVPTLPDFFDGFAIVPTEGSLDRASLRDSTMEAIKQMEWLRSIAPTPAAQRKYTIAVSWLTQIQMLWDEAARAIPVPSMFEELKKKHQF